MNNHQAQWQQLYASFKEDRLSQATVWLGPLEPRLKASISQWSQLLVCSSTKPPCLTCADCLMVTRQEHPDVEWIRPEKGAAIKIDQIRQLKASVYLTPQRAPHRLILIEGADRMNLAAANAFLKILEEPPAHTLFILSAQQLMSILPTVLSRCCLIRWQSDTLLSTNVFNFNEADYLEDPEKVAVIREASHVLEGLIAVIEGKEAAPVLAAQWAAFDFYSLLWFLYLVYAQLLQMNYNSSPLAGPASRELLYLSSLLKPMQVVKQLDIINTVLKKINQQLNPNPSYALEHLLLSL